MITAHDYSEKLKDTEDAHDFLNNLTDLIGSYDLPIGDFTRVANWGIYNGKPVIIDLGLSNEVLNTYYKLK